MEDIQAQMGAILNNPEMMQKIMSMAQAMGQSPQEKPEQNTGGFSLPNIDMGMIQKLTGFAQQSGIDSNQKNLLHALGPYLNRDRIEKLEKAMRAAKMARMASSVLGQTGLLPGTGR